VRSSAGTSRAVGAKRGADDPAGWC
jgi:hypothetical protein